MLDTIIDLTPKVREQMWNSSSCQEGLMYIYIFKNKKIPTGCILTTNSGKKN